MKQYFPEVLISILALSFAGIALFLFFHGEPSGDAFKWASRLSEQLVAAVLTLVVKSMATKDETVDKPNPTNGDSNGKNAQ